jgi:3',5'-cyclic AMP phosphodiesterase CpdA
MRLIHISDLHFGAVDPGLPDNLRTAIIAAKADLLVVSGDLTQRGLKREFRQAREFLDSLPLPRLVVPGNHDVQGSWNFWERFLSPFRNYRNLIHTDLEPVWSEPGLIVTGANSARPAGWNLDWSRGRLSRRQVARMAGQYAVADAGDLRVMVVHHPPAAPPDGTARHLLGRLKQFTGAVNEAGVDLVLSGHFHMSYAQALPLPGGRIARSCVLSSVSTATSHRLKGETNGFHLIEGNQSHLTVRDWAWTGNVYAERRAWEFEADPVTRDWRMHPVNHPQHRN